MERPALQNERVGVIRMAFRARKVFGTFEKRTPDSVMKQLVLHFSLTFEANKKLTFGKIKGAVYFRKGQVCILSKRICGTLMHFKSCAKITFFSAAYG